MKHHLIALSAIAIAAAAPAAAAARSVVPIVPTEFRGEWDLNAAACASRSGDGHLTISTRRVGFYESEGPVVAVRRVDRRTVRLSIRLTGEGVTETRDYTFRVSPDGHRLSDVTDPSSTRVRCA